VPLGNITLVSVGAKPAPGSGHAGPRAHRRDARYGLETCHRRPAGQALAAVFESGPRAACDTPLDHPHRRPSCPLAASTVVRNDFEPTGAPR